ncbi:MAG: carbohydrate binding family 9 domain-containing protein, partial [Gemmatimonadetes bacterium]|nr:carbohydrate binding family 9 domain-containing protein [Gemmatimonadota bacterium]
MFTEIVLLGAALAAPADSTPPKTLAAHRLAPGEAAPVLDGRLDDAAWARAAAATGFVQVQPRAGEPATERTEARVVYDDGAVYVAMRAYDPAPDSIAAQLGRRDASRIYSDWMHVLLDSYHDRRSAYRFSVTPRGVKQDAFHFNDGNEDTGWDAVWDVATRMDSAGWTAEFRIPLSQLRFKPRAGEQSWGVQFGREVARREERTVWAPMPPSEPGFASRFGTLTGLAGLRSPRRLELLPYTVASVTREPGAAADPFYSATAPYASMGADLKYGLAGGLTLTATINPDFGQVEADPSEVNLSAFESFFSEKRPFFVEGGDIFQFGVGLGDDNSESLFYSRRIGRQPQRGLSTSEARPYVDAPQQTTILGAAKLTGKVAGWSVGVLDAVTAQERTRYLDAATGRVESVVSEPMANYAMARVRRDLRQGRSAVGAVLTATHRFLDDDPALLVLPSSSVAGGVDLRHRFGAGDAWEVSGYALGSTVRGDTLAIRRLQRQPQRYYQRPDAGHLDFVADATSLTGSAASLHLGKIGGQRYRGGVLALYRSPGFEVNELGYLREADKVEAAAYGRWFQFQPKGAVRRADLGWNLYSGWTTGGERTFTGANLNGSINFTSLWGGYAGVERSMGGLGPRSLRGGPALRTPGGWGGWTGLWSDSRKRVSGGMNANWGVDDQTDGYRLRAGPYVNVRSSSRLSLSLSPSLSRSRSATQYVGTRRDAAADDSRYLF